LFSGNTDSYGIRIKPAPPWRTRRKKLNPLSPESPTNRHISENAVQKTANGKQQRDPAQPVAHAI
jgi:hypothetical protein